MPCASAALTSSGRSPRVRGSLDEIENVGAGEGSIPACAGEPGPRRARGSRRWINPRVCGGALYASSACFGSQGRSPRVRGSPFSCKPSAPRSGSIPACAGEPLEQPWAWGELEVDPRVCGGAAVTPDKDMVVKGRSPRVRGSRKGERRDHASVGSIPACAGEPKSLRLPNSPARVDPRVCGGAGWSAARDRPVLGRSPRVRGSPLDLLFAVEPGGSIPACAGEPSRPDRCTAPGRVDPRVCGGAFNCESKRESPWGRSPRVRGSQVDRILANQAVRSIPACAGEPWRGADPLRLLWVDPRVCGGALNVWSVQEIAEGRSPRVRGSLSGRSPHRHQRGSIPACAGEPGLGSPDKLTFGVDPRVCGGATFSAPVPHRSTGRSPRVRGSLVTGNTG